MSIIYLIIFLIILTLIFSYFYMIRQKSKYLTIEEGNINLYKQQVLILKRDYDLGNLNEKEFRNLNDEITRRILDFNSNSSYEKSNENKNFPFIYKFIILFILTFSIVVYGINGKPEMPDFSIYSRTSDEIPNVFWDLTLNEIENKIVKNPDDIAALSSKANVLSTLGRTEESVGVWRKILSLSQNDLDVHSLLSFGEALINYNLDKEITNLISEEAMGIFLKVSNLSPVSTEEGSLSRYYISIAALEKGDVEQARLIWEEIKLKVPEDFEWKKNILENISKLEVKFSIAENDNKIRAMVDKLEKRLLDNDSNDISDWKMLGKSSLILQEFDRAELAYTKAYELNDKDIEVLIGLAESRLFQNKKDEYTIDLYKKILIINENHPLALWVVSEYEILNKNNIKGLRLLEKLLSNLPVGTEEYNLVSKKINELKN